MDRNDVQYSGEPFGPTNVPAVIRSLSSERFATYRAATADDTSALALYEWNATLCSTFYWPLQIVEITLRNAMHGELVRTFGDDWADDPTFLAIDPKLREAVRRTRATVVAEGKTVTTPRIVAASSFGFWTTMLSKRLQNTLWASTIVRAFPTYRAVEGRTITRPAAAALYDRIRPLRNRVAHHEPIFEMDLRSAYADLSRAVSWHAPGVHAWMRVRSSTCERLVWDETTRRRRN